jgi:uncharacterized membrane protein
MKLKEQILLTLIAIISGLILIESGIFTSLLNFLLVGAIPGTTYSVPPAFMLLLIFTVSWIFVLRFINLDSFSTTRKKGRSKTNKKHLPKRRYGEV